MSDTVSASIIVASLDDKGPSFVTGPGATAAPMTVDAPSTLHVSGGAHVDSLVSGFGSPLLVDFVGLPAARAMEPAPPTVGGFAAGMDPQDAGRGVVGAIHQVTSGGSGT